MKDAIFTITIIIVSIAIVGCFIVEFRLTVPFAVAIELLGAYYLLLDEIAVSKKVGSNGKIDLEGSESVKFSPATGKIEINRNGTWEVKYQYGKLIHKEFSDALRLYDLPRRFRGYYIHYFGTEEQMKEYCKIDLNLRVLKNDTEIIDNKVSRIVEFTPIRKLGYIYLSIGLLMQFIFSVFVLK